MDRRIHAWVGDLGLPNRHFKTRLPTKIVYTSVSTFRHVCSWLNYFTVLEENNRSQNFSLQNFITFSVPRLFYVSSFQRFFLTFQKTTFFRSSKHITGQRPVRMIRRTAGS